MTIDGVIMTSLTTYNHMYQLFVIGQCVLSSVRSDIWTWRDWRQSEDRLKTSSANEVEIEFSEDEPNRPSSEHNGLMSLAVELQFRLPYSDLK